MTAPAIFDYSGQHVAQVSFSGGDVFAIEIDGKPHIVLRSAIESLGLDYSTQLAKLKDRSWACVGQSPMQLPGDAQRRTHTTVDVRTFLMLLATINENNVSSHIRPTLIAYQSEVADAVEGYFARKPSVERLTPLQLAERLVDAERRVEAEHQRRLELEGPAAQAETFRAADGLCTIGDLANRFQVWAKQRFPEAKVLHRQVFDHAARVGLIIRGNTVRHNQPTSQSIKAGWAKPHRAEYDTNTRGMQTTVSTRLTSRGEARLWDHLVAHLQAYGSLGSKELT